MNTDGFILGGVIQDLDKGSKQLRVRMYTKS